IIDKPATVGDPYAMFVNTGRLPQAEAERILTSHPEVRNVSTIRSVEARPAGGDLRIQVNALGGAYERAGWIIDEGRMVSAPGEAVAGWGLMDTLGLRIGDDLRLTVDGRPLTLRLVGRYRVTGDHGRRLITTLETLRQQLNPQFGFGQLGVNL